jgi:hypothetical protein
MTKVNVAIANISAERFWDIRKPIPPHPDKHEHKLGGHGEKA